MLLCWVLLTTLLGVYLENVPPENSTAVYKRTTVKDFTTSKDTEKAARQQIYPPNKFQKLIKGDSILREIQNRKTSKTEDKNMSENETVQNFLKPSVETKKTKETLMPSLETATKPMEKQLFAQNREKAATSEITNHTSSETKNEHSSTREKDANRHKTHLSATQQTENDQESFTLSGSGSEQSPKKETIATQITENDRTNARDIEDTRITIPNSKARRSVETGHLSESKIKNWFVALYRQNQYQGIEVANCGTRMNPCYYLKTVMSQLKEGDTLILISDHSEMIFGQNELNKLKPNLAVESTS